MPLVPPSAAPVRTTTTTTSEDVKRMPEPPACPDAQPPRQPPGAPRTSRTFGPEPRLDTADARHAAGALARAGAPRLVAAVPGVTGRLLREVPAQRRGGGLRVRAAHARRRPYPQRARRPPRRARHDDWHAGGPVWAS